MDRIYKMCYNIIEVIEMGNKYTDAQKRAAQKYKATRREQLNLDVPKGIKEKYKAYAQSKGVSLTKLIMEFIEKDM